MVSQTMVPALLERLGRDHARITSVTRELAILADAVNGQTKPDWQRMKELVEFLCYYADRVHHPLEDKLFDRLLNKGLTPTERRLLYRNLDQ